MKKNTKLLIGLSVSALSILGAFVPGLIDKSTAASDLEVFPSNSRLSFSGALSAGNTADASLALIQTAFNATNGAYSTTSAQLVNGDLLTIGANNYVVATTSAVLDPNEIALSTVLNAADIAENTSVYNKMGGPIKITFTPNAGITNGSFIFYFPAATNGLDSADGLPNSGGFDFNNATITCPTPTGTYTGFTSQSTSSEANNVNMGGNFYHSFVCNYTGTSAATPLTFNVTGLINPAPKAYNEFEEINRTIGAMDIFGVIANQKDNLQTAVKGASTYAGFGNAVKMTVKVLPQLTFTLQGVAEGSATACGGLDTDVTTTGFTVPFGSISNTNFTTAAQKMSIVTNAANGYVVTAIANDQMGLNGDPCAGDGAVNLACIKNFGSVTVNTPWADATAQKGFGYTMSIIGGDSYLNGTTPNVATTFNATEGWRSFPDKESAGDPVQLINNLRSTNGDTVDVCYRIVSDASNIPGDYKSTLTYTITASF